MRRSLVLLAVVLAATLAIAQSGALAPVPVLTGFGPEAAAKERALEVKFDAALQKQNLRDWMQRLSARPHNVGSPYDKENVEFIASLFRSWGYDTKVESFDVLYPTPKTRLLELLAPEHFVASLQEKPLAEDRTSGQTAEQLPTYNAYSADGDVTGELVYANYGIPADYEVLERNGIDVRGKIVITRYGGSWRGIKPKVAAEHGAIGCIIYSDPRDDGYYQGDVYPKGAFRNDSGAQRGSVADMPTYPGDPLTPGVGATKGAKRLDRSEAQTITKIPVLPISYADALPLLRAMEGPVAPPEWRGALPITYHLGGGAARVHLKLEFNWDIKPVYDVIARMDGTDLASEWIMRGNHQDAWVNGASDPLSGQVAMLEEARSIAGLVKGGWRPRRTIVYAAWDGEEPGLLGSTEWVETHVADVRDHLAVYINSDSTGRGFLNIGGSHTLERFVTEVARDVRDPERGVSVLERLRARLAVAETDPSKAKEMHDRELIRLDALGSGSDYTPFLQHAGIASLDVGYGGESPGGSYHSIFDSFDHFLRFGDPTFDYVLTQTKTTGRLVLRLADSDVLPFEAVTFASTVDEYLHEVIALAESTRAKIEMRNQLVRDRTMELAADPTQPFVAPKLEEPAPFLDFAPLQNAVAHLRQAAHGFDRVKAGDATLMHLEQLLTREQGLPRRPWYRHYVYAPGYYTGYGVKTLPTVREAIEQHDWREANEQIVVLAGVLDRYAAALQQASN